MANTEVQATFEVQTCGRCGGTGQYSYCQMYGRTCFGCRGKGRVYTKRGLKARALYQASLQVPVTELQVGDSLQVDDSFRTGKIYFAKITAIEYREQGGCGSVVNGETVWHPEYRITAENAKYGVFNIGYSPDDQVRKGHTAEFKQARLAEALAYQARLTKTGKERKVN